MRGVCRPALGSPNWVGAVLAHIPYVQSGPVLDEPPVGDGSSVRWVPGVAHTGNFQHLCFRPGFPLSLYSSTLHYILADRGSPVCAQLHALVRAEARGRVGFPAQGWCLPAAPC